MCYDGFCRQLKMSKRGITDRYEVNKQVWATGQGKGWPGIKKWNFV